MMKDSIPSGSLTQHEVRVSAAIIQQRHAQFLEDGISLNAKAALEKLKDELGISKTSTSPGD